MRKVFVMLTLLLIPLIIQNIHEKYVEIKIQTIKDSNKILRDLIDILYDKYEPKTCQDVFAIQLILIDKINKILLQDEEYEKTRQLKQAIADLYKYICEDKKYNSNRAYEILTEIHNDTLLDTNIDIYTLNTPITHKKYFKHFIEKYIENIQIKLILIK